MSQERKDDKKLKIKAQYIDSEKGKNFAKRMETLNKETSEIINSEDDIVSLRKEEGRNVVGVEMSSGEEYRFSPNQYTQLFYDKVEKQNQRKAKIEKTRIEVIPFQNKIQYINGETNEFLGQIMIDTALQYEMRDKVTGEKVDYGKELNPAILALLDEDRNTQKAYMQGNDNLEIVYDFTRKSPSKQENRKNRKIARIMDKFFHSENKFMERKGKAEPAVKIGFATLKDKIKAFFNMPVKKVDDKQFYDEVDLDELVRMDEEKFIPNGDDEPTEKLKAVTEEDIRKAEEEKKREELKESIEEKSEAVKELEQIDQINTFIEEHSIVLEEKKKAEEEEKENIEIIDLAECTVEDREGNIVLDTKEKEDIKRMAEKYGNFGKANHMGYRKTVMPGYKSNKKKQEENDKEER